MRKHAKARFNLEQTVMGYLLCAKGRNCNTHPASRFHFWDRLPGKIPARGITAVILAPVCKMKLIFAGLPSANASSSLPVNRENMNKCK
jgi:hypothetical protein